MNKSTFLLAVAALLFSCSKSIYFAYEKDGHYATIEVTKEEEVIYRSSNVGENVAYASIRSQYGYLNGEPNEYVILKDLYWLAFLRKDEKKFNTAPFSNNLADGENHITYKIVTGDSISLLWNLEDYRFIQEEAGFVNNGITWFPPYMVRVKKIDYTKFDLSHIKRMHLKNPDKAPKVWEKEKRTSAE